MTDQEIIDAYRNGASRGWLGLKAGVVDSKVVAILTAAGIPLRTASEIKAASAKARLETLARKRKRWAA